MMIPHSNDEKRGFLKEMKTLLHSALTLPRVIMQIVSQFLFIIRSRLTAACSAPYSFCERVEILY